MKNGYKSILYTGMVLTTLLIPFLHERFLTKPESEKKTQKRLVNTAAPSTGVSEATLSDIRSMLEKQEYHISYDEQKKLLQSPNRAHNLRVYYQPGKLTVQTRKDTTGRRFKLELVNDGIFADGKPLYKPQTNAEAKHHQNKVQISHEAFTEEFINNEDGVRQNFIVNNAPVGTRRLQVKIAAKGLKVQPGEINELRFYSESIQGNTQNELVYSDLKCWDANKQPLTASLAYVNNHIEISVDVAGAAYPVTIDPIIANGNPQNANKIIEVNQSNMWLGFSVSSAGDVNGDGYSDVIVGAPLYDKGQTDEGAAFIYPGTANGLSLAATTIEGNQTGAQAGYSVSSAGDYNADGYSDVLVGAPFFDDNGAVDAGSVVTYYGSDSGIGPNSLHHQFCMGQAGSNMGVSVAMAGDVNGDGYSDFLIGAHQFDRSEDNEGIVIVVYGRTNKFAFVYKILEANQPDAMFGFSVASAGDVNGDGYSDVLIGARLYDNGEVNEGAVFVYKGSADGLDENNPVMLESNQTDARMGHKVSSAGDVNGDGYSDILVSTYLYDNGHTNEGKVDLHLGSAAGITTVPAKTYEGGQTDARLGTSVACAGDVNGDGYADILLGAQYYDNGQNNEGAVFVYHGSADGLSNSSNAFLESNQGEGWFGTAVASAGDVNGDGYSDILIGCYTYDNGQNDEGHAFVYHGCADGISQTGFTQLTSNDTGAKIGFSVASAGDVNADGYDDVIVGAPYYDLGQSDEGIAFVYYGSSSGLITATYHILQENQAGSRFGAAVAGAGDVNGDGFDDIVVGAHRYSNGQDYEGVVFIYHGSSTGIVTQAVIHFEGNFANSYMGSSVASAGDVNKDGYTDIIVGAPGVTDAAYVYNGSANGVTGNPKILQSGQNSYFGSSVASAGDVNGDGYGDVIVGDRLYGQDGAAFIFYGSNAGIATIAAVVLQSNQPSDFFMGNSVAGAGDINGDGYSDVIVDILSDTRKGIVLIYYGSLSGVSNANPVLLEINKGSADFAGIVNSAGDVNGDGYSDIVIGVPKFSDGQQHEGAVYVFHGSSTGIKTTTAFQIEYTNISDALMGHAVAGAGDVNGDGYSDIIVGAPGYLSGQNATGSAFVYYGNNGKGLRNNVRLFNSDLITPLNHNQFSQPNFACTLFAKSFIGKDKGKFVWEAMGSGTPFSKVGMYPITTSTQFTGASPDLINLSIAGTMLGGLVTKDGTSTKVRVRVRYSPVLAITGQMYGPWRYLQRQLAGYNNAPVPEEALVETIEAKTASGDQESFTTLFPNPVSDRLHIRAADLADVRAVRICHASGSLVFQSQHYENGIDVSKLPTGAYVVTLIRTDNTSTSHRVLIRR